MNEPLFVIFDNAQGVWWCASSVGYTVSLLNAGVYTEAELKRANTERHRDKVIPLDDAIGAMRTCTAAGSRVIDYMVLQTRKQGDS